MITHRQRCENCLVGAQLDRPLVALWRHFPVDDQSPERLAAAILYFQKTFDFDLVKVTPASSFCIKDWGAQDEWRGATEGTRTYTNRAIHDPDDWARLQHLDPSSGFLKAQLDCLSMITGSLEADTPVLQTIFSPLAQAKNLVGGENLLIHLRRYPDLLKEGLQIITDTTRNFIRAACSSGMSGIFYAVQHAQYGLLTESEFKDFGMEYDLQVLEEAKELWLNMIHIHGNEIMFDIVRNYPIQIINWHDRDTYPSLEIARTKFDGILCGGLQREQTIVLGDPDRVTTEAVQALDATDGKKFILGTGCVVPITAPFGNLMAARNSVENYNR